MSFPSEPPSEPIEPTPSGDNLPEDANLLKAVLPPLLEDFRYWFARTITLLDAQEISFLSTAQQQDLLSRVQAAQQQVNASQALSAATDSQAGIEMSVVMTWHKLVHECWSVAIRYRKEKAAQDNLDHHSGDTESTDEPPGLSSTSSD